MFVNVEDITPIDCGEPVKGLQPAIVEVDRLGPMHRLYAPVLVDHGTGAAVMPALMPVPYRMELNQAFDAAIAMGQKIGAGSN